MNEVIEALNKATFQCEETLAAKILTDFNQQVRSAFDKKIQELTAGTYTSIEFEWGNLFETGIQQLGSIKLKVQIMKSPTSIFPPRVKPVVPDYKSEQSSGPFNTSARVVTPSQFNLQPYNINAPIFPGSQVPVMSNLFAPQDKPSVSLLAPHQQQIPSNQFGSQAQPFMFKQVPVNPLSNDFKLTNEFTSTQNTEFKLSTTGNAPQTPSTGFPFPPAVQLPTQQITPTTPQTPTDRGFNKPSGDVSTRVIKTARRRIPHNN